MYFPLRLTLFIFHQQFTKLAKLLHDKANLPIARYQDMIVDAVRANQTVIVAGDTGCGKSTQVSWTKVLLIIWAIQVATNFDPTQRNYDIIIQTMDVYECNAANMFLS